MRAVVDDRLHVHVRVVGTSDQTSEIIEIRGRDGAPPYLVRPRRRCLPRPLPCTLKGAHLVIMVHGRGCRRLPITPDQHARLTAALDVPGDHLTFSARTPTRLVYDFLTVRITTVGSRARALR